MLKIKYALLTHNDEIDTTGCSTSTTTTTTLRNYSVLSHHARTFWNMRSHGPAAKPFHDGGVHGCCHAVKQRSGWGIIARWRPSFEHSDVRPPAEPFGFNGYASVGVPWSST